MKSLSRKLGIGVLLAFGAIVALYLMVLTTSLVHAKEKDPVIHTVYCQETGNGWKIVKGDDSSDNQNRVPVGFWDEHERDEKWNAKKASDEFLSKCPTIPEDEDPKTPVLCPAGSTLQGYKDEGQQEPICKLDPTGCPYGDSIPLGPDCDKHAPAPETPATTSVEEEAVEVFYGK